MAWKLELRRESNPVHVCHGKSEQGLAPKEESALLAEPGGRLGRGIYQASPESGTVAASAW